MNSVKNEWSSDSEVFGTEYQRSRSSGNMSESVVGGSPSSPSDERVDRRVRSSR